MLAEHFRARSVRGLALEALVQEILQQWGPLFPAALGRRQGIGSVQIASTQK